MKENDRWLTEAMDHLDPALIEDMDSQATAKRRPAPVRVLLIAACTAALLAVGAVAAEVADVDLVEIITASVKEFFASDFLMGRELEAALPSTAAEDLEERGSQNIGGFVVSGLEKGFSWANVSQEFYDAVQNAPDTYYYVGFETWDEAEALIGVELANNPMLESFDPLLCRYYTTDPETGKSVLAAEANGMISANHSQSGIGRLDITAQYGILGEGHEHTLYISISNEEWEAGHRPETRICRYPMSVHVSGSANVDEHVFTFESALSGTKENYVTPNGLETTIYQIKTDNPYSNYSENFTYQAVFSLNNILYCVSVNSCDETTPQLEPEVLESTLKSILDAYEVPQE